jgi:hypothetical protein
MISYARFKTGVTVTGLGRLPLRRKCTLVVITCLIIVLLQFVLFFDLVADWKPAYKSLIEERPPGKTIPFIRDGMGPESLNPSSLMWKVGAISTKIGNIGYGRNKT